MIGKILSGKVALVAGGSGGIGSAVAVALAEAGADVALTYRSGSERARTVVEAIEKQDRRSLALEVDVRRRADVEKAVALVAEENNGSPRSQSCGFGGRGVGIGGCPGNGDRFGIPRLLHAAR